MTPTTERTEAGDQFVAPGFETTFRERVASVQKLMGEARAKMQAATKLRDHGFATQMRNELERLRGVLAGVERDARRETRADFLGRQGGLF